MNINRQYAQKFLEEVVKPKLEKSEAEKTPELEEAVADAASGDQRKTGVKFPKPEKKSKKKGEPKAGVEKTTVTIRLDTDVIDFFKAAGDGYQTRINSVLREYMQRQA
jgi:uncharacterized protein (DUF4415 family)